jgi:ABC-2 type transport system permease protein
MTLRHELLLLRRDRGVAGAVLLLAAACTLAVAIGVGWRNTQHSAQVRSLESDTAEYAARRAAVVEYAVHPPPPLDPVLNNLHNPLSPYVVGQAGRVAHLPLPPAAALAIGQYELLPLQELVSIRTRQRTVADKDGLENPLQLAAGRFDLAFVVVYLLPLLILALTYNLVALEREEGTLGLLRCQAGSLGPLLLARALLRTILLAGICAAAAVAGAGVSDPIRVSLFIAVLVTYALFWAGLALWVNSREGTSTANAATLALAWVLAVAIVPAAVQLAVNSLRPVPSRLELLEVVRIQSIDARRDAKKLVADWYAANPQLVPAENTGPLADTATGGTLTHIEQDRRTLPVEAKFESAVAARQDLVSWIRFLSPAIVASEASLDSAGTSLERFRHYKVQVRQFRELWLGWFHPPIFRKLILQPADYDRMPAFHYREFPVARSAAAAASGAAMLAAGFALLALGAVRRLR